MKTVAAADEGQLVSLHYTRCKGETGTVRSAFIYFGEDKVWRTNEGVSCALWLSWCVLNRERLSGLLSGLSFGSLLVFAAECI